MSIWAEAIFCVWAGGVVLSLLFGGTYLASKDESPVKIFPLCVAWPIVLVALIAYGILSKMVENTTAEADCKERLDRFE